MTVIDMRTRQVRPERTYEQVGAEALERFGKGCMGAAWAVLKPAMTALTEKVQSVDIDALKEYTFYMWLCGQLLDYVVEPAIFCEFQQQVGNDMKALSEKVKDGRGLGDRQQERLAVFCISCSSLFRSLAQRYPDTP